MNLTILSRVFYPQQYATGQIVTSLAEKLVSRNITIEVYSGQPVLSEKKIKFENYIKYKSIKIFRVSNFQFSKNSILGRLLNDFSFVVFMFIKLLFKKIKGPILVFTNPPILSLIAVILKKIKGNKIIYLIFDVYPDTAENLGVISKNGLLSKIWNILNKIVYKNSDYIVVIGRCMEEVIKSKILKFGIEEKLQNVKYIPIWTDDEKLLNFGINVNKYREKWQIKDKFVVLYSGNMGRFHDLETIMDAAKALNLINKKIIFLFVGNGYKRRYVEKFVNENALTNCIIKDFVVQEEHPYILELSNICLLSLKRGQVGLSVPSKTFSYWAMGKPVIAILGNESEIARIIFDYKSGFVVKNGDYGDLVKKIMLLYNDEKLRKNMSENAKKLIIEKYNLNQVSNEYFNLIKSLKSK